MRAFNSLYYRVNQAGTERATKHYRPFFYPARRAAGVEPHLWPARLLSVPVRRAARRIRKRLSENCSQAIAASGQGSFLSVLKTFSARPAVGMLSFPMAGTTLALDFPNLGPSTLALLQRLCAIVDAAGGRLYPAKDAFMPARPPVARVSRVATLRALSRPRHLVADVASPRRSLRGVMPQRDSRHRRHLGHRPRRLPPLRRCPRIDRARRAARRRARGQRRGSARSRRSRRPHRPARCSRPVASRRGDRGRVRRFRGLRRRARRLGRAARSGRERALRRDRASPASTRMRAR